MGGSGEGVGVEEEGTGVERELVSHSQAAILF